jgi:hypothetical protein
MAWWEVKLKKQLFTIFTFLFFWCSSLKADLFGGDILLLTQILANAVQQLSKLQSIIGTAQDNLNLVRQINQGINDSLNLMKKISPNTDPGMYGDWQNIQDAMSKLNSIYGEIPDSNEAKIQKDTDTSVAEAITFNNQFYKYTKELDQIGEDIQNQSHAVSPGGAAKLSAQALGLIVQILNQNLRAQSSLLKIQAQGMAVNNRQEKAKTKHFLSNSQELENAMKKEVFKVSVPRF